MTRRLFLERNQALAAMCVLFLCSLVSFAISTSSTAQNPSTSPSIAPSRAPSTYDDDDTSIASNYDNGNGVRSNRKAYFSNGCPVSQTSSENIFIILFYPGLCSFIIGCCRVLAMVFFFLNNLNNRQILSKIDKDTNSSEFYSLSKKLILPTYYPIIYLIIMTDFIFGMVDIILAVLYTNANNSSFGDEAKRNDAFYWIYPIQFGIYHVVSDGLAIFYTKNGAGAKSMLSAGKFCVVWFLVSTLLCYMMLWLSNPLLWTVSDQASLAIGFVYNTVLLISYIYLAYSPDMKILYRIFGESNTLFRRPALINYAKFNIFLSICWYVFGIASVSVDASGRQDSQCATMYWGIFVLGIMQPYFIWRSLVTDSNYWQGYFENSNPLKQAMEQVSIATAASISDQLSKYETDTRSLPLLHFGQIEINDNLKFVAGGVSRIYFGKFKDKQVAVKLMYLMEFNPSDISEFFAEATILHTLKSPRIVECFGVCVMPPAVTMILEFCSHGSLFSFLHDGGWKSQDKQEANGGALRQSIRFIRTSLNAARQSLTVPPSSSMGSLGSDVEDHILTTAESMEAHNPMASSDHAGNSNSLNAIKSVKLTTFNDRSSLDASGGNEQIDRKSRGENRRSSVSRGKSDDKAPDALDPIYLYVLAMDAVEAISFIHSKGYMHCDLKSLNFLVTDSFRIKLTDFGEARHAGDAPKRTKPPIAALNWAPPEVLTADATAYSYTMKSDIYGLAIIVNEILSIEIPFKNICIGQTYQMWHQVLTSDNIRPKFSESMPPPLSKVLSSAWHSDPGQRCLSHDILAVLNSQAVTDYYSQKISAYSDCL